MASARRAWIPDYDTASRLDRRDAPRRYDSYDEDDDRYMRRSRRSRSGDDLSLVYHALSDIADRVSAAEDAARAALDMAEDRLGGPVRRGRAPEDDLIEVDRRLEAAQADLFAAEDEARRALRHVMDRTRGRRAGDRDDERLSAVTAAFSTLERRLDEMMRKLEQRPSEPPAPSPAHRRDLELLDQIRARLDSLAQRVEAPPQPDRRIESTLRGLEDRLSDLVQRIETPPAPAPQRDERLARIEAQLTGLAEHLARPPVPAAPAPSSHQGLGPAAPRPATFSDQLEWERDTATGNTDLATAIREIVERQKQIDAQSQPEAVSRTIDERFRELTDAIARRLDGTPDTGQGPVIDGNDIETLRRQIGTLQRTLESAVSKTSLAAIVDEVRAVGEKVDAMRRSGVSAPELKSIETEIAAIRQAVESAIPRESFDALQQQIATVAHRLEGRTEPVDPDTVRRLTSQLADVQRHIADAMPAEAFRGLVEEVRALDRRIAGIKPAGDVDELRREIAALRGELGREPSAAPAFEDLKARIERLMSSVTEAPAIRSLEARVDELANRLTRAAPAALPEAVVDELRARIDEAARQARGPHGPDIASLELQMHALASKLDQMGGNEPDERQMRQLEVQIGRLADALTTARDQAVDAARQAATDAVREALSDIRGAAGTPGSDEALVRALQKNLADLRQASDASERRTQDTLVAVHETLRKVVDRLSDVEGARSLPPAPGLAAMPAMTEPAQVREPAPGMERPLRADPPASTTAEAPKPAEPARDAKAAVAAAREAAARAAMLKADPSARITPDLPLEPGSGRPKQPMTAADAVRAAREQIKAAERPAGEREARQSFITAARKAVAAAAEARGRAAKPPKAAAKPADGDVGPTWSAPGGADAPVSGPARKPGLMAKFAKVPEGRRKQIVMAMAAIVIVLGALQVLSGMMESAPSTPPAQVAQMDTSRQQATDAEEGSSAALSAPSESARPGPSADDAPREAPPTVAAPSQPAPAARTTPSTTAINLPAIPDGVAGPRLTAAAQGGDIRAIYDIGNRISEGRGTTRDLTAAIAWWRLGVERNHAPSLYRLANAFEKGQGVARDPREAMRLYQRAADLGNRKAMHNLAALLAAGADGRADYDRAFPLFQKAAELGLVDSQYNLAVLFVNGLGTRQNLAEAYTWFHIAAQNGDGEAGNRRDEIARRLEPAALVNARLAAQNFRAKPFDPDANEELVPAGAYDEAARASRAPVEARPDLGIQVGATQSRRI